MRKKNIILLISIFLLMIFVVGCGNSSTENSDNTNINPTDWQINLTSYDITNWVDSEISGYGYEADSGYNWILINLEMTNITNTNKNINWMSSTFKFISADNNIYSLSLAYNDPPGYIDTNFKPQQTKNGFIAFEIPKDLNVNNAKLKWFPEDENSITIKLTNLTEINK